MFADKNVEYIIINCKSIRENSILNSINVFQVTLQYQSIAYSIAKQSIVVSIDINSDVKLNKILVTLTIFQKVLSTYCCSAVVYVTNLLW